MVKQFLKLDLEEDIFSAFESKEQFNSKDQNQNFFDDKSLSQIDKQPEPIDGGVSEQSVIKY